MLRVLTLSTLFPDASRPNLGPFVELQTRALAAHPDVELQIVAPRGLPPAPFDRLARYAGLAAIAETEIWKGLTVHRPRFVHLPRLGAWSDVALLTRRLLPELQRLRESFAFDVIDAEFFFPDGPVAVALGAALGVPVSIKARGADIHYWGKHRASARAVADAGERADGLLAVSAALRDDMVALGMPRDKIRVHYTGVDLSLFAPRDRIATRDALGISGPLIVSVGALIARKRHHLVLEAVARLPGVQLALIGRGELGAALVAQAERLGIGDRFHLLGPMPHAEIARWLGAADVMCLPSASEGLANAWVEALACGTPIVITDVGGARELVDRPEAGALVAPDPAAIAQAIRELLASPPPTEAVRAVAERFTWPANRDALYAHLAALVSGQNPRSS